MLYVYHSYFILHTKILYFKVFSILFFMCLQQKKYIVILYYIMDEQQNVNIKLIDSTENSSILTTPLELLEKNINTDIIKKYFSDTQITQLIKKYKDANISDIPNILIDCMIEVEKLNNITSEEKKETAENLFYDVFISLVKSGLTILGSFIPVVNIFIPSLIEIIISATKGLFDINKIKPCLTNSWNLLRKIKCCKKTT